MRRAAAIARSEPAESRSGTGDLKSRSVEFAFREARPNMGLDVDDADVGQQIIKVPSLRSAPRQMSRHPRANAPGGAARIDIDSRLETGVTERSDPEIDGGFQRHPEAIQPGVAGNIGRIDQRNATSIDDPVRADPWIDPTACEREERCGAGYNRRSIHAHGRQAHAWRGKHVRHV